MLGHEWYLGLILLGIMVISAFSLWLHTELRIKEIKSGCREAQPSVWCLRVQSWSPGWPQDDNITVTLTPGWKFHTSEKGKAIQHTKIFSCSVAAKSGVVAAQVCDCRRCHNPEN